MSRTHGDIKCVILAPNLETGGAVDKKVQEIIDMGQEKGVMLVFALNRRKLGKALGKTVKVSIVGVQNMDGANQEYKQLYKLLLYLEFRQINKGTEGVSQHAQVLGLHVQ